MRIPKKALLLAVQRGVNVADAFSTDLYTGTSSVRTITNGIDLENEGGLVWIKERTSVLGARDHALFDTERGALDLLESNTVDTSFNATKTLTAFNVDGFDLGQDGDFGRVNYTTAEYASWTFRQAPKFFDIVTYTGDGAAGRAIPHNLGVTPGMIVVKCRTAGSNWQSWHRSLGNGKTLLNLADAAYLGDAETKTVFGNGTNYVAPTDSFFTVGTDLEVNGSGSTYVAYLWAHDPSDTGIIKCGSYDGNGSINGPVVDAGGPIQWLLVKRADNSQNWYIFDIERGMPAGSGNTPALLANSSSAEITVAPYAESTPTGFQITSADAGVNANGGTFIYVAIRAPE